MKTLFLLLFMLFTFSAFGQTASTDSITVNNLMECQELVDIQDSMIFRMFEYKDSVEFKLAKADSIIEIHDVVVAGKNNIIINQNRANIQDRMLISSLRYDNQKLKVDRKLLLLIAVLEATFLFYYISK